jgi:hypothetical protein
MLVVVTLSEAAGLALTPAGYAWAAGAVNIAAPRQRAGASTKTRRRPVNIEILLCTFDSFSSLAFVVAADAVSSCGRAKTTADTTILNRDISKS